MKGIGDFICKTLKVHFKTQSRDTGHFARICVGVDLTKKLRPDFIILGERYGIQYEGIHLVCFNCGVYGHKLEDCPLRRNTKTGVNENSSDSAAPMEEFSWIQRERISLRFHNCP